MYMKAKNEHLFAQCIHNKLHWVKKELLEYHLKGCLDKVIFFKDQQK